VSTGTTLIVAGAFLACAVEMVEALTILLSVGVAAGVAVALAPTALLTHEGVNAWWLLPVAVVLALSLRRAAARAESACSTAPGTGRQECSDTSARSRPTGSCSPWR
jgi:membrane protein implicated in regulation of membrane protease activity